MKSGTRLAFLGGGNMAWALIQGLLRHGVAASQLCVGESFERQRARLQAEFGVRAVADNRVAVRDAPLVVLAVKPEEASSVLADTCPALAVRRPLLLSIVAGTRIADLASRCADLPILRAMPNRPALVGAGATALFAGAEVDCAARARRRGVRGGRDYGLGAARVRP